MRTMLYINNQTETMEIGHIIATYDNCLYIPASPCGLPIIIQDVKNPYRIVERLNTCGWADLSMLHARYLDNSFHTSQSSCAAAEHEIEQLEFER